MSDASNVAKSLRERLGGNTEERLGRALSDLLENPLLTGAIGRAFDAREKASQAQEVALGALNIERLLGRAGISIGDPPLAVDQTGVASEGTAPARSSIAKAVGITVSAVIIIFAAIYKNIDFLSNVHQFEIHGKERHVSFVEAVYFSLVTVSTLGFGDIAPTSFLVRALTGMEVVTGVLMLLFGFSEIMRSAGSDRESRPRSERRPPPPSHDST